MADEPNGRPNAPIEMSEQAGIEETPSLRLATLSDATLKRYYELLSDERYVRNVSILSLLRQEMAARTRNAG